MRNGFVGRVGPLAGFAGRLADLRNVHGTAMLISGEPGIGKSRLLDEYARMAAEAAVPVLSGRAAEDSGAPPYWPWTGLLERARDRFPVLTPDLLTPRDALRTRFEIQVRTVAALAAAADRTGLVVLLDDLHWADELSLLLASHLCRDIERTPVLFVGAYRDTDLGAPLMLPPQLAEIVAMPAVHATGLAPLEVAEVAAYVRGVADTPVDDSWMPRIHARSGGNALFVRELTRLLVQQGALAAAAADPPLPVELRSLLAYRLDRLSATCREVVAACATIGDQVDPVLLDVLVEGPTAPAIAEAVATGVLVAATGQPRFSHSLLREVAYAELPHSRRLEWHARLAAHLDGVVAADSARMGERASHWMRSVTGSESARSALVACRDAARHAVVRLAFDDAAKWYAAALDTLPIAGGGDVVRAQLLLDLAAVRYWSGEVTTAMEHCTEAMSLAERLGDRSIAAAAAVLVQGIGGESNRAAIALCERAEALLSEADGSSYARVLAAHSRALAGLFDYAAAEPLSRAALAVPGLADEPVAMAEAVHARHQLITGPDGIAERLALGTRLRDLAAISGQPGDALWGHLWRLTAALEVGTMAAVDSELGSLTALVDRHGWPLARWHSLRARSARHLLAGRFAEAEELIGQARDVLTGTQDETARGLYHSVMMVLWQLTGDFDHPAFDRIIDNLSPFPVGQARHAHYHLAAGDLDRAMTAYRAVRPQVPGLPKNAAYLVILNGVSEVAITIGDRSAAQECYELLLPYAMVYNNPIQGVAGSVSRLLGMLAAALDQPVEAERHFVDAIAMERRISALPFQALAELEHAKFLVSQGARGGERARALLESCLRTARRLGMAPTVAAASTLAEKLTTGPPLSRREREIALLVADGLSNRQIAERFVLSERTVETHVRSMLAKLGLGNRTHVAAWVARGGLG